MVLIEDKKRHCLKGTLWVRSADVTMLMKGEREKISLFTSVTGNKNNYKQCDVKIKLPEPRVDMKLSELHLKVKGGSFTDEERMVIHKFIEQVNQ